MNDLYLLFVLVVSSTLVSFNEAAGVRGSCQQESLTRCTDPLKVLTNNRDLGFAASQQELNALCPKLIDGLRCIDNFTGRCLDAQHREFFHMLYAGTKQVIVDLCEDEDYQQEYLSHAPCMKIVQTGYEQCALEYQSHVREHNSGTNALGAADDPVENSRKLCCSFQNYMKCSQTVVEGTCGTPTASFTRGFLDTMAGPLIQGYCLSYEPGTVDVDCGDSLGGQSGTSYGNYDDAMDRSSDDGIDETEFVSTHHSGSSSAATGLQGRGATGLTWFLSALILLNIH